MSYSERAEPVEGMKIGVVAQRLGISIRTIHMYEREGLFISRKNSAGTRYFTERDVEWLMEIRRMIKAGIGIAGIRHLLSLIPCWEIKGCTFNGKGGCPVIVDHNSPCWANKSNICDSTLQECRQCDVYELRHDVGQLKQRLYIRLKTAEECSNKPQSE
ncbi:MerR family transcriptional regulator [Candidatus Magnetaquicoccus inordinatus]|uniref:MerR family transcriptional regulator n=1 Tax=Candidatus Magnetaquicoccus inordinatus TaxID=2496818 RepID=UPI00102B132D|nr:MerR family transcriptional regulator [Candidatus Magnetaquicoccus inordinatus]